MTTTRRLRPLAGLILPLLLLLPLLAPTAAAAPAGETDGGDTLASRIWRTVTSPFRTGWQFLKDAWDAGTERAREEVAPAAEAVSDAGTTVKETVSGAAESTSDWFRDRTDLAGFILATVRAWLFGTLAYMVSQPLVLVARGIRKAFAWIVGAGGFVAARIRERLEASARGAENASLRVADVLTDAFATINARLIDGLEPLGPAAPLGAAIVIVLILTGWFALMWAGFAAIARAARIYRLTRGGLD